MKKLNLIKAITLFLSAIFIFSSCMTESKFVDRAQMNTDAVPEGFNPARHILLVAEMPRLNKPDERNNSVTNKLDKALKESCPYKYEIVSMDDINNLSGKYKDTSVYKYAILNSLSIVKHTTTTTTTTREMQTGRIVSQTSVSPSARTTYIDFAFYDRTNGIRYRSSGNRSPKINYTIAAFMKVIRKVKG